ncbi:MAG: phosphatidylserine decarboxylase [Oscillospiraceae bacterium]|nr:phosphatidylserine decarboxylase [Oscillospiraceae bacterium]
MKQKTRNGVLRDAPDGQDRLLSVLYGSTFGRILLKPLTTPWISRLAGHLLSTRASCVLIHPFIRSNHIDMEQFEQTDYASYNEFFARKIRPELRPVDTCLHHLISPCDSKLTVLSVTNDGRFRLKQTEYTAASLLKNEQLARQYEGGYLLIFRLTVDDYHRYCYLCDGETEPPVSIPGVLHTVNPIANDYFPIYKENCREYTILHTEEFGDVLTMEVGALLVGKIINHHRKKTVVHRGEEKGYFQFGGSTVVVMLPAGAAEIDADILANSADGIETIVKYGEKIGFSAVSARAT